MKRISTIFLAVAMALSFASCKDESNDAGRITLSSEADLNPVLSSAGGTYTIEFTADNDWKVVAPNTNHYSWSSITPTSGGSGKNQITVTVLKNADYDGREYSFDLRCGTDSKTIKVSQKQLNSITLTPETFAVPKEGGSIEIKVMANIGFDYKIADEAKDWISAVTTKGLVENTVTFAVASNEIYNKFEARQGVITFTSEEGSEDITVNQAPNERIFNVTPEALVAEKNGGDVSFKGEANFPYEVAGPEVDWVSMVSGKDDVFTFKVGANPDFGSRATSISVTTGLEDYSATIELKQKGTADVNVLWRKSYSADLSAIAVAGGPLRLAVKDDILLVGNGGNKLYALNRQTGELMQEIPIPEGLSVYSLVNDDAGNVLVSAQAAFMGTCRIYSFKSLDAAPELVVEYAHNAIWSSSMGNIRVRGDVTKKAVITAFVDVSQYWVAWQITDGKAGEARFGSISPAPNTVWNPYGACVAPVSDDLGDGLLFIGYSADANGNYDLNWCKDVAKNEWLSVFHTDSAGNENYNCISVATLNGIRFCAVERGAHFSWGSCPEVYLFDITDLNSVKESYYVDWMTVAEEGAYTGAGACSDVLLQTAADGKTMDMFVTDGNYDCLTCIRFTAQ